MQLEKNKKDIWGILLEFNKLPLPVVDINRFVDNRNSKVKSNIDHPIQVFKIWKKHEQILSNLFVQCSSNQLIQKKIRH